MAWPGTCHSKTYPPHPKESSRPRLLCAPRRGSVLAWTVWKIHRWFWWSDENRMYAAKDESHCLYRRSRVSASNISRYFLFLDRLSLLFSLLLSSLSRFPFSFANIPPEMGKDASKARITHLQQNTELGHADSYLYNDSVGLFTWHNIGVAVADRKSGKEKQLLNGVSGEARAGIAGRSVHLVL